MRRLQVTGYRLQALIVLFFGMLVPMIARAETLREPLSFSGISRLVEGFITAVSYVAFPALLLAVVIVGFLYVSAQGNASTIHDTHGWFLKVLIAVLVISGLLAIFTMGNAFIRFLIS